MNGLPNIQGQAISQSVPRTNVAGASHAASARVYADLAVAAVEIGNVFSEWSVDRATRDAKKDFVEAVDAAAPGELPQIEGRSGPFGIVTSGDAAYNNMVETMYLQRLQVGVEGKAAELRADPELYGNVEAFDARWSSYKEGLFEEVSEDFALDAQALIQDVELKTRVGVAQDRVTADAAEAKTAMDARISSLSDQLDALARDGRGTGDPEYDQLARQLFDQLQIKTNNPFYGYSEEEAANDSRALSLRLKTAQQYPVIEEIFERQGYAGALEAADAMADAANVSSADTSRMRTLLRQEVNLLQQNRQAREAEEDAAEVAAKDERERTGDALDKQATRILNDPNASVAEKKAAVERTAPFVSPSRFGTLYNQVSATPPTTTMPEDQYTHYWRLAQNGELTDDVVFEQPMSEGQRSRLLTIIEKNGNSLRKSGVATIRAAHNPGSMEMAASARQILASKEEQAIQELDAWIESLEHPPSPQEVTLQVNSILADGNRAGALIGQSRYLSANMLGQPNPEKFSEAKLAIRKDLESGAITKDEAEEQYLIIVYMEDALNVGSK